MARWRAPALPGAARRRAQQRRPARATGAGRWRSASCPADGDARARGRVPQAVDIRGLVAAHLTIGDAGLGALGAVGSTRCHAPPLGEAIGAHEPAQRGVGRHRLELGRRFGQCDEVVVMELDAPALMRSVLREDGLAHGIADRNLPSGVGAQLAAEHADRIGAFPARPVIPSLDGREAEPDRIAGGRMLPRAGGERHNCGLQLALGGRRRQQLADHGKAQLCRAHDYAETAAGVAARRGFLASLTRHNSACVRPFPAWPGACRTRGSGRASASAASSR